MEITFGSQVRSFDFHYMRDLDGPRSCYMEGQMMGHTTIEGCERYIIAVKRCVVRGEETNNFPEVIYPPVNGTPTWTGRTTDGVEVIK